MGIRNEHNQYQCGFHQPINPDLNEICPAQVYIWLINSFLEKTEFSTALSLEKEYSTILQNALSRLFPGVQVIWTVAKEKPKISELYKKEHIQRKNDKYSNSHNFFNEIVYKLNETYHSQDFFRKIIRSPDYFRKIFPDSSSEFHPAHFFYVSQKRHRIVLNVVRRETLDRLATGAPDNLELVIYKEKDLSLEVYYKKFKDKYRNRHDFTHEIEAINSMKAYIDSWNIFFSDSVAATEIEFNEEMQHAAKHFALICLYMLENGFDSCSYFLSPNLYKRHDSSMVIFWSNEMHDRNLHYLLQLLLKLNSYPLLMAEKFKEDVLSERHTIYNMMPTEYLQVARSKLKNNRPEEALDVVEEAIKATKMLELSLAISLQSDDRIEKLEDIKTIGDILKFLEKQSPSFGPTPNLLIKSSTKDYSLRDDQQKADAYTCIWNLWHNAAKIYSESDPKNFTIILHSDRYGVYVEFVNECYREVDFRIISFLKGTEDHPKGKKGEGKKGLEVVVEKLSNLGWMIHDAYWKNGFFHVSIFAPVSERKSNSDG